MASAVLPSRNEPYWGDSKVYMRKYANNQPHFNNFIHTNPISNPNRYPSPNHALSRQIHENGTPYHRKHDKPPYPAVVPENGYRTFNLAAYTRVELREIERRLRSELEQVRSVRAQIESRSGYLGSQFSAVRGGATAAPPPRPPPVQVDFQLESNGRLITPPKANQNNKKKPSGKKRGIPFGTVRDPKRHHNAAVVSDSSPFGKLLTGVMKRCKQILVKLMKHKFGFVFNTPVDVVALRLHDYHTVIKNPMDLGTVKSRLEKNEYKSPLDFAGDVRLTFENAKTYNAQGSDVYIMAGTLVSLFDKLFGPAYTTFEAQCRLLVGPNTNESEDNCANSMAVKVVGTPRKLPKPKARDPYKRQMNFEEKEKLGLALQELPGEKMGGMLDIIRRRNSQMTPEGDEIELDIEALDVETLWELDRFVDKIMKAENKRKRQVGISDTKSEPLIEQASRKGFDAGEEDVDIGEDIPVNVFPPVEIEKDDDDSSSSSSSSDSSSSSGSDSGSSSGSDSEEDSVQSPFVESKGVEAVN